MNKNSCFSDFNLFLASDALLGVLEAIHEMLAEVPAEGSPERARWDHALTGLAWAGRRVAREMSAFLEEASDMHRFPFTYPDIESRADGKMVREPAAVCAIR